MSPETVSWKELFNHATADAMGIVECESADILRQRLEALEAWVKSRIEACRTLAYEETADGPIVNMWLKDVQRELRLLALIELRIMNAVLRGLGGKKPIDGCRQCTKADACFDGSVECVKVARCAACGHAWSLHVVGHQCAGTVYEGGRTCPCEEMKR